MEYELYHYGILGMKWGIRRFQNKDGSLTAAGRKRYLGSNGKEKLAEDVSQIEAKIHKLESKNPSTKNRSEIDFLNKMKSGLLKNIDVSDIQKGKEAIQELAKSDYDGYDDIPERNRELVEENAKKTKDLSEKLYKGLSEDKAIDVAVNRLRDQLGGPDQIDDPELLDLVLMEEKELLDLAGFKSTDKMVSRIEKKFSGSGDTSVASKRQQNDYDGDEEYYRMLHQLVRQGKVG